MKDKKVNGEKKNGGKERIGLYLTKENLLWMENNREAGDIKSRSEFVNRAIDFYAGFLKTEKAETYVMQSMASVLHSSIDLSEMRIKEMLYKLAVELAMQNRILARMARVTEKEIEEIRIRSEEEVRKIFL